MKREIQIVLNFLPLIIQLIVTILRCLVLFVNYISLLTDVHYIL